MAIGRQECLYLPTGGLEGPMGEGRAGGEVLSHAMWTRVVRLGTTLGLRYDLGLAVCSNWCSYDAYRTRYILEVRPRSAA